MSNRATGEGKPSQDDDEPSQVWLLPAQGGEPRPVTDEPLGVTAFRFAAEGGVLGTLSPQLPGLELDEQREAARDRKKHGPSALRYDVLPVRFWDHWLPEASPHLVTFDDEGGARHDWTPDAGRETHEAEMAISRDGRRACVTYSRLSETDRCPNGLADVFDLETGERLTLDPGDGAGLASLAWSPDGTSLAACLERRDPKRGWDTVLRIYDATTGEGRTIAADWDAWPALQGWTPDSRTLLVTADDRGRVPVCAIDVATGRVDELVAESAGGSHSCISSLPDGERLVGIRSTLLHPPEPFIAPIQAGSQPTLLAPLSGFSAERGAEVASVESLEVASSDGAPIHCYLLKPAGRDDGARPHPTVLWIHGGPMGAWVDGWHWRWNALLLVAAGYAIAAPNPRGSTGFGRAFTNAIWGNVWGAQCFEDVMAVADALEGRADLDPERMAAMGGSFGGYMTNWLGGSTDRFRCLITHASVYSMSSFYGDTDLPAYWALAMGGYPYADPEFDRYSPSTRLDDWTTATLIIHGERDYRVPVGQALALFEGLQYHGVDSELLVFPDENHWILKPRNILAWYEAVLEYLDRHLADSDR